MGLTLYQYDGCDTCKKALRYLKEKAVDFEAVPIRGQPPSVAELKRVLDAVQGDLRRLFNTSGKDYRELGMKDKLPGLSEDEALELLASNGNLIKRPVALGDGVALVGFRESEWGDALGV